MKKLILLLALSATAQTPKPVRVVRTYSREVAIKFIEEHDPGMKNERYAALFRELVRDAPYVEFVVRSEPPK